MNIVGSFKKDGQGVQKFTQLRQSERGKNHGDGRPSPYISTDYVKAMETWRSGQNQSAELLEGEPRRKPQFLSRLSQIYVPNQGASAYDREGGFIGVDVRRSLDGSPSEPK